jgi:hypothetical protein
VLNRPIGVNIQVPLPATGQRAPTRPDRGRRETATLGIQDSFSLCQGGQGVGRRVLEPHAAPDNAVRFGARQFNEWFPGGMGIDVEWIGVLRVLRTVNFVKADRRAIHFRATQGSHQALAPGHVNLLRLLKNLAGGGTPSLPASKRPVLKDLGWSGFFPDRHSRVFQQALLILPGKSSAKDGGSRDPACKFPVFCPTHRAGVISSHFAGVYPWHLKFSVYNFAMN